VSYSPPVSAPDLAASQKSRPPASVTHFGLSLIALAVVLAAMYALRVKLVTVRNPVMFLCAAVAVPVVTLDVLVLKVHLRESTGIDWDKPFVPAWHRVATKLLGFTVTLAPFALAYWAFPEYNGSFYEPFYDLFRRSWAGLLLATATYFTIVDSHMREPKDSYWRLGSIVLGTGRRERVESAGRAGAPYRGWFGRAIVARWDGEGGSEIANHYRGWLVKAYFFPLMFVWLNNSTYNVVHYDLTPASWANVHAYTFLYDFIFFIDLVFTTVGYALCFRPLDTHIRTAEPTMLGWAVALFCYEPFFSGLMEKQYVKYGGIGFDAWLHDYPTFRWAWAFVILFLITIYVLATITFGVRFSNLTHRGILTNGPYRFTKHPAYVSKNISWWLASVPFVVTDDVPHAIRRCMLLAVVNFMYFMRAKTEERHLSRDPTYVAYALWMNDHGWLRFLRVIPIFRYDPPAAGGEVPCPPSAPTSETRPLAEASPGVH
jgi:protein-S-isoprenylcysteine O-methyltransferase Ste14